MSVAISTRSISVPASGLSIDAYLAEPTEPGHYPPVIVIQEIFGVNAHIRDVTERFAKAGYVAIAPALYQRIAPGFQAGYTLDDVKIGRTYKEQTQADQLLADVQGAIAFLQHHPNVRPGGVGCIGFCFGGHVAYLAATLPEVSATASFYGAGLTTWCPGGGEPTVTRTAQIRGHLYAFFGMEDASIPMEQVDRIEAELVKHQVPHRVLRYANADHGFFCDQRSSYNAEAANDAWQVVQELFRQTL